MAMQTYTHNSITLEFSFVATFNTNIVNPSYIDYYF